MTKFETFAETYQKHLGNVVLEFPDQYPWAKQGVLVSTVAKRMMDGLQSKSINKDGLAFARTCKELGIKNTYKAIYAYVEE